MRELTRPGVIVLKGVLFLVAGVLSAGVVLLESPTLRTATLLCVTVWCFARFYYFAFYVVERWVDPTYRFTGICSLAAHMGCGSAMSCWRRLRDSHRRDV